ncbi:hypothetical protein KUCAC02_009320 [Chaenocephalus aceratus]|uniref:Uncharacterized protein n=1 Tax=Chaenocephalus aceratus TaxID=36190 RepID=A0ACB9WUX0_CHAAC|nr:hypothetical protein KUCAC02_009320 [Chaenocephalus aceratus]
MPVSSPNSQGRGGGQCDWISRMHPGVGQQGGYSQPISHNMMGALHGVSTATLSQIMGYQNMQTSHLVMQQQQQHSRQLQHQNSSSTTGAQPELPQRGSERRALHAHPHRHAAGDPDPRHSVPHPPSQHSYSGPMDHTPNHQLQVPDHPFLTPSPGSPDQWSSSSPHSNMSDWSEGISSPPTSIHSQMNLIPEQFK